MLRNWRKFSRAAFFVGAAFFISSSAFAKEAPPQNAQENPQEIKGKADYYETYKDLINKARNLTLQRDRLQTSQVLLRGIQRELKNSPAQKELIKTLDNLTSVFYTDKAQTLFAAAEAQVDQQPREALEQYQAALNAEDKNVAILKAIARAELVLSDCDKADGHVKQAEGLNPFSAEVRLLRLQVLSCQKNEEQLSQLLNAKEADWEGVDKFVKGLQLKDLIYRKETKRVKSFVAGWEQAAPDYPEVYFWKWTLSREPPGLPDRAAAMKYSQLCQNMSPRKKKSFNLDVDLCKGKEAVETFLKSSGFQRSTPMEEEPPQD